MPKAAIIGTTTWGTTLGIILARKGLRVKLWARTESEAAELNLSRQNARCLPGIPLPSRLTATASPGEALDGADVVVLAAPAQTVRQNIRKIKDCIAPSTLLVNLAKGLEVGRGLRLSQVIAEEIPSSLHRHICALSGPNLAKEIVKGLPAAAVVAAGDESVARRAQFLLSTSQFGVFTSTDVAGVEMGGALKNVIALGAGITEGLGYGDNAKATYMTWGWSEMVALGIAEGARPETFNGLAGLGDLVVTCISPLSRNHTVGLELAKGHSLSEIMSSMNEVAEGVATTQAVQQMAQRLGVDMPITRAIHRVLFEGLDPRQAVVELFGHPLNSAAARKQA
ncbi:MAG: NAD(P)-dependent glycerol-3-phosphate dehydrogenase [Chloroflexi bacterium]|nr:NAD(P)-dependent glycerol-3-phosphate dehydrogenase [Chloroflexota bacterium]